MEPNGQPSHGRDQRNDMNSIKVSPLAGMLTFFMSSKVDFEDISLCHPDVSAQHGQHVADIATFDGSFHVICRFVLLIANILAMQQPASAGEA